MTTLTLPVLLVVLYGAVGRGGYVRALALGGATVAGAAIVVGDTAVPTFYAVAVGAAVALAAQVLRREPLGGGRQTLPPGAGLLLAFLAWTTLVTLVAPFVFDGMPVLSSTGAPAQLVAGVVTTSNIAQTGYLLLGVCVMVFVARSPHARPELIGLAVGLTVVLSFWRHLHVEVGLPFPESFFDNSPTLSYVETAEDGSQRFRGILSEPAGLALSCLVAASYFLTRISQVVLWRRAGAVACAAVAIYLGFLSTSTTFVVAGAILLVLAVVAVVFRFLARRAPVSVVGLVLGITVTIVSVWAVPVLTAYIETAVDDKTSTASFGSRGASNANSWQIFFDTGGFGTGLGATRGSAFLPSLLSTGGAVGTLLLGAAVLVILVGATRLDAYRPVIWALVAFFVTKFVSGPDLSDPSGVLWISLGMLSGAAMRARSADPETPGGSLASLGGGFGPRARLERAQAPDHATTR